VVPANRSSHCGIMIPPPPPPPPQPFPLPVPGISYRSKWSYALLLQAVPVAIASKIPIRPFRFAIGPSHPSRTVSADMLKIF
jgi:hypothetical protein